MTIIGNRIRNIICRVSYAYKILFVQVCLSTFLLLSCTPSSERRSNNGVFGQIAIAPSELQSECKNFHGISRMNLSKSTDENRSYLELIMSFSYEGQVEKFLPFIKYGVSQYYYEDSKDEPILTIVALQYSDALKAQEAHNFLYNRWVDGVRFETILNGDSLLWIAKKNDRHLGCLKLVKAKLSKSLK